MKKLFFTLVLCLMSVVMIGANQLKLNGTYVTEDYNTKSAHGMIKVTYTFTNDSLYIDAYPSGCGIAAMSFVKQKESEYKAIETLYDNVTGDVIQKRIYHLSIFPCLWDKNSLAVYRDGVIVDIIKLLEK